MTLRWNNKRSFPEIGIATSVAYQFHYDWQKTINFAYSINKTLIQFYLPEKDLSESHLKLLLTKKVYFEQGYFHLPPRIEASAFKSIIINLKKVQPKPLFIQHQQFMNDAIFSDIEKNSFVLALENDQPGSAPDSFLKSLQYYGQRYDNICCVLDVSRMYHQYFQIHGEKIVYEQIIAILSYCSRQDIPLIFHVIDHHSFNGQRSNWCTLFEGDLPWMRLFDQIYTYPDIRLKSVIFEYEDFNRTRKSIVRLEKYFLRNI